MLWTRQNISHWIFTLILPLNVKRSNRLLLRILANTGSSYGQALRVDSASLFSVDFFHHLFGETLADGDEQLFAFGTSSINASRS